MENTFSIALNGPQALGIYLAELGGSETRRLLDADLAVYAAGQLLFVQQGKCSHRNSIYRNGL
jgi:hypothetical protein